MPAQHGGRPGALQHHGVCCVDNSLGAHHGSSLARPPPTPSSYTATMGACQEPMTGHPAVAGSLTVAGYTTVSASKAAIQSAI